MQTQRSPLKSCLLAAALALALSVLHLPARGEDRIGAAVGDYLADNPEVVERIVAEYLLAKPELIESALNELARRREAEAQQLQADAIARHADLLFSSDIDVELGNPDAKTVLVEFYDYNCTYCRQVLPDVLAVLDGDPDLRLVLKSLPVLGEGSFDAALVGNALHRQDPSGALYRQFHEELFSRRGIVDKAAALETALALGADAARLTADMQSAQSVLAIEEARSLADDLGISGTPSFLIGSKLILGAIGIERLKAEIEEARRVAESAE